MLTPVPRAQGAQGVRADGASRRTLLGIEAPARRASIDLKPYATSSLTTDMTRPRASRTTGRADVGFDAKYGVTQNLAADLTVNTDFAQVEADQQQINLTRFSLFFPEKREFFLENPGTFSFGGVAVGSLNAGTSDAPILFYSRRIGLNAGARGADRRRRPADRPRRPVQHRRREHPVSRRGRRAAPLATNFTVARVKRDILSRSSIGAIATNRSVSAAGAGRNLAYGLDGTFVFFKNLQINTYWARTESDRRCAGRQRDQLPRAARLQRRPLRRCSSSASASATRSTRKSASCGAPTCSATSRQARFSPRPGGRSASASTSTRRRWTTSRTAAGRLETRAATGEFALDFQNADRIGLLYTNDYEFLPVPFAHRQRDAAGGRLRLRHGASQLQPGPAARGVGQSLGGLRHVLRRPQDDAQRRRAAGCR